MAGRLFRPWLPRGGYQDCACTTRARRGGRGRCASRASALSSPSFPLTGPQSRPFLPARWLSKRAACGWARHPGLPVTRAPFLLRSPFSASRILRSGSPGGLPTRAPGSRAPAARLLPVGSALCGSCTRPVGSRRGLWLGQAPRTVVGSFSFRERPPPSTAHFPAGLRVGLRIGGSCARLSPLSGSCVAVR